MDRFRRFVDAVLNVENIKNSDQLKSFGVRCTYLPDPVEEFDEFEFRTDFYGKEDVIISFATEMGKIKRLMFGEADPHNPDVVKSMTGEQLKRFLSQKGDEMVKFYEFITQ